MNGRLRTSLRGTPRKDHPVLDQINHGKKTQQDQNQYQRAVDQDGSPARSACAGGLSRGARGRILSSNHALSPFRGDSLHRTPAQHVDILPYAAHE